MKPTSSFRPRRGLAEIALVIVFPIIMSFYLIFAVVAISHMMVRGWKKYQTKT